MGFLLSGFFALFWAFCSCAPERLVFALDGPITQF